MRLGQKRVGRWVVWLWLALLAGCGIFGPDRPDHSFQYDVTMDSPDVQVLDYRYGHSKLPPASNSHAKDGRAPQATGVTGSMLRGEFLYVKWRIKSTGQEYEDNVDLRQRLPRNITKHIVYFSIKGPQLYVWLISPEKKPADWPVQMPRRAFSDLKTYLLYPDQPGQQAKELKPVN